MKCRRSDVMYISTFMQLIPFQMHALEFSTVCMKNWLHSKTVFYFWENIILMITTCKLHIQCTVKRVYAHIV